jgi:hypothetical protein
MTENKRPIALTAAVSLVLLEAAASLIYALLHAWSLIFQGARDFGGEISVVVFFLLVAAWLFFASIKLLGARRWARNAILFWQFMQIAVASAAFDAHFGNIPVGIAGMAPAILIVVLLFMPKVIKITTDETPPGSEPSK